MALKSNPASVSCSLIGLNAPASSLIFICTPPSCGTINPHLFAIPVIDAEVTWLWLCGCKYYESINNPLIFFCFFPPVLIAEFFFVGVKVYSDRFKIIIGQPLWLWYQQHCLVKVPTILASFWLCGWQVFNLLPYLAVLNQCRLACTPPLHCG